METSLCQLDLNLHPKQGEALNSEATEILYGGAAGGGKSHLMRVAAIIWCAAIPGLQVYLFRRIRADLIKSHMDGPKGFRAMLAGWQLAGFCKIVEDEIRFWNGSKIYLCHCKDAKDVYKYQGAEIHVLLIDELTHFTEPMYRFLRGRCRMVGLRGVLPEWAVGRFPRILCGANPGNIGHLFVKRMFVDGAVPMQIRQMEPEEGGKRRQYIPALLEDNPSMAEDDPTYEHTLSGLGNAELVRAMRWGDWDIALGAFFTAWNQRRHVLAPFTVPAEWTRFVSKDWGSASPGSVGWWAIATDSKRVSGMAPDSEIVIPRGALVRYREWYIANKDGTGLKLSNQTVAKGILEREKGDKIAYRVLDPSCFAEKGGPSIAEDFAREGVHFKPADNTRVARGGANGGPISGWAQMNTRLVGNADGQAMIFCFSTCLDSIRTIPTLMHDEANPEDVNCWVAGTLISTPSGDAPIELVKAGDLVDTPIGPRRVLKSHVSGVSSTVWVRLSNGRVLQGTPDHKVVVRRKGLVALKDLMCDDTLIGRTMAWERRLLSTTASLTRAIRGAVITIRTVRCWARAARACIARFGWMRAEPFLMAGTSTTATAISTTTRWPTSNVSRPASICDATTSCGQRTSPRRWRSGDRAHAASVRCETMPGRWWSGRRDAHARAAIVAVSLALDTLSSAIARALAPLKLRASSFARHAQSVAKSSGQDAARRKKSRHARIVAVGRCADGVPVFNLTVVDAHLFYANGVLSSNTDMEDHCADEWRYACMSRPWLPPVAKKPKPRDAWEDDEERAGATSWKTI